MKSKTLKYLVGLTAISTLLFASSAFAQAPGTNGGNGQWQQRGNAAGSNRGMRPGTSPGVFGTVSALSGNTLTITSKAIGQKATTTYAVDATNATVMKDNATSTLSSVAVGDTVSVRGTISGTSVTATMIRDGLPQMMGDKRGMGDNLIQGNGQPVVGGAVTAVTGSTFTISNKSNATFNVDASSAIIQKQRATSTVSDIIVGDNVIVQGTVNGSSITASSVMDQGAMNATPAKGGPGGGIFSKIGGFFKHMFGFF